MNIVFFCQSCGSRFEVPPALAGKHGRCKHCGQMMSIPRAHELASMVAMPAVPAAAAGAGAKEAIGHVGTGDSQDWLARVGSDVGLAPLTMDNLPVGGPRGPIKPKYDDDLGDSKPYALAPPVRPRHSGPAHPSSRPAGALKRLWRRDLGFVQKAFRLLNEGAYLVSVPFLMLVLLGAVLGSRPLALAGATAVVLLEVGRVVAGVANLAVIPFREGLLQGVAFLVPPFTFVYLSRHWDALKRPTMRVVGPVATIAAVVLAFALVPSLRRDGLASGPGGLKGSIRREVESLEGEMVDEVRKARSLDVQGLEERAKAAVGDAASKVNSIGQPGAPGRAP